LARLYGYDNQTKGGYENRLQVVDGCRARSFWTLTDVFSASICTGAAVGNHARHTGQKPSSNFPNWLHEEVSADYKEMIYAGTRQAIETKRKGVHPQNGG
jgi:hypothetical protein